MTRYNLITNKVNNTLTLFKIIRLLNVYLLLRSVSVVDRN